LTLILRFFQNFGENRFLPLISAYFSAYFLGSPSILFRGPAICF